MRSFRWLDFQTGNNVETSTGSTERKCNIPSNGTLNGIFADSWLDAREDAHVPSTRRRCDTPSAWIDIESLPAQDDTYSVVFGGFNYSTLFSHIYTEASKTQPSIEFRASTNLGCDVHIKSLDENFFKFYTPEHLTEFYSAHLGALQEIKDDATLYASLLPDTRDEIEFYLSDSDPFKDYELNFAAHLMTKHETLRGAISTFSLTSIQTMWNIRSISMPAP